MLLLRVSSHSVPTNGCSHPRHDQRPAEIIKGYRQNIGIGDSVGHILQVERPQQTLWLLILGFGDQSTCSSIIVWQVAMRASVAQEVWICMAWEVKKDPPVAFNSSTMHWNRHHSIGFWESMSHHMSLHLPSRVPSAGAEVFGGR